MPLDGIFLSYLTKELRDNLVGSIVQKIYQPSNRMIIIVLRKNTTTLKLLISSNQNSPRVHITCKSFENPQTPTAFCMFLRKKLSSAKIKDIRQHELERVVFIDFEHPNELGDSIQSSLVCEIMGKYSNIILVSQDNTILDSIIRVNSSMSSRRLVLPGYKYKLPPSQGKMCFTRDKFEDIINKIFKCDKEGKLENAVFNICQGVSRKTSEILIKFIGLEGKKIKDLNNDDKLSLSEGLENFIRDIYVSRGEPVMILGEYGDIKDVFFNKFINCNFKIQSSFSSLLDEYYYFRDKIDMIKCKVSSLEGLIKTKISRCKKKIENQNKELDLCKNKDMYKIYGDLLLSNLYFIKKGMGYIDVKNFYSGDEEISIKLDPRLSGADNAKLYYKKYNKYKKANVILAEQIKLASEEIKYLESILEYLSMCENNDDIEEVKKELYINGYLKDKVKTKNLHQSKPLCFVTKEGLKIFVGKNSIQNEKLTFKIANKSDIWFHVKDMPGSHTILFLCGGKKPSNDSILYAAKICCLYSKAKNSSNVAVDYTNVSNVRKIPGGKSGMVNYKNYKTVYVTPSNLVLK